MRDAHREVHGKDPKWVHEGYWWDIANKLARIAVSPEHMDSWEDIIGYSTRIIEDIKGKEIV